METITIEQKITNISVSYDLKKVSGITFGSTLFEDSNVTSEYFRIHFTDGTASTFSTSVWSISF